MSRLFPGAAAPGFFIISNFKNGSVYHKKWFTFDIICVMMYMARDGISHGVFCGFVLK